MTSVNEFWEGPAPLPALVGFVFERVRSELRGPEWGGLRSSHLRVLSGVPSSGVSVTELAERIGMTKQGAGQFVASLTELGFVSVTPDPDDRRARIVRRSAAGSALLRRFAHRIAAIEQDWADAVGPERFAVFRAVLEEIATLESDERTPAQIG